MSDTENAKLFRQKAEELRTMADDFYHLVSAARVLEKTARIWEQLADTLERRAS